MACNVRIQNTAIRELDETVEYLLSFGPQTAKSFLNEWEKTLEDLRSGIIEHRLSKFETLAKLGYHTILIKNYIILYYKEEKDIVVAHLFHQSQDYARLV